MKCVAAILARNEADRYLESVLLSLRPLCDEMLLLDDNSTDNTMEVAERHGCQVRQRTGEPMWGKEAPARAELWDWGAEVAGDGWLLIADADQELVAPIDVWKALLTTWSVDAWAFKLYDTWDASYLHRSDSWWQGYKMPRPWLFRPKVVEKPVWNDRALHVGHAPHWPWIVGVTPDSVWWRHRSYERTEDRVAKRERYLQIAAELSPQEIAHAESICP